MGEEDYGKREKKIGPKLLGIHFPADAGWVSQGCKEQRPTTDWTR